jgi:hypothetical protein
VNTAAKSVFIWDKKIDGTDVDFFTFANIRGRAGRMGRHYVGKVFYFHPAPTEVLHDVQVPGLGAGGDIDEILVHYEANEIPRIARQRISGWQESTGFGIDELKRFGGLGFDRLVRLKELVGDLTPEQLQRLSWRQFPEYNQLKETALLIWAAFNLTRSGPHSASQLTLMLWRLFKAPTLTSFFRSMFGGERPSPPDDLFAFLRSCEFSFPEMLMCLQISLLRNANAEADYSLFVARLENWFRPEAVKSLEEVGFPIVLFERLGLQVTDSSTVEQVLASAMQRAVTRSDLSSIEIEMISDAQSGRVVAGK